VVLHLGIAEHRKAISLLCAGATINAIATGLAFTLDVTDPVASLFDEAGRRILKKWVHTKSTQLDPPILNSSRPASP
jgi:hypothetical protein